MRNSEKHRVASTMEVGEGKLNHRILFQDGFVSESSMQYCSSFRQSETESRRQKDIGSISSRDTGASRAFPRLPTLDSRQSQIQLKLVQEQTSAFL